MSLPEEPTFPTPLRTEIVPCVNGRFDPNRTIEHNDEFRPYCGPDGQCIECQQHVAFEAFAPESTSVYWNRTLAHNRPLHYYVIKDPVWMDTYYGGWNGELVEPSEDDLIARLRGPLGIGLMDG